MFALADRCLGRSVWWLCLLLFWFFAHPASAQQDQDVLKKARAQFQQATELEQAQNYSAALQAFREVGQVKMTPQVRFHIALCEEKLGKLVAALGGYELAQADAEAVGPNFRQEVEAQVATLRERIPKVVIQRGTGAEAAEIDLDGVTLGASSIGVEVPIDPGPHTVTATMKGYKDYAETITVAEKETKQVTVELVPVPVIQDDTLKDERPRDMGPAAPPKKYRWLPWAIGGVGVVALGLAYYFNDKQAREIQDVKLICGSPDTCDFKNHPDAEAKYNDAKTYNTLTNVFIGTGIAAIAGGVTLYLVQNLKSSPPKQPAKTARSLTWTASAPRSDVGLSLVGSF